MRYPAKRGITMRYLTKISFLVALIFMLLSVVTVDEAQAWGKKKKKSEEPRKAVNLEKHPEYKLYRGVLRSDNLGTWKLDKRPLSFNRNSRITPAEGSEEPGELEEGREALVMAANIGGSLIVRRVTMISVNEMVARGFYGLGSYGEEDMEKLPVVESR